MEENVTEPQASAESGTRKLERWEELYIKYAEAVKNPSNLYLSSAED
jgi:hypothetical protein